MLTEDEIYEITLLTTVSAIKGFAETRLGKVANFQILDLIMPKERSIRSIVGGLETSLGTRLWEPLAEALAAKNGFTVLDGKGIFEPKVIPKDVIDIYNEVIDKREHQTNEYNALTTKQAIQNAWLGHKDNLPTDWKKPPRGTGVDVWIKKDNINYIIDTKTVQPNLGAYKSYLRQIISWYLYFYAKEPDASLEARIVFPYNPYKPRSFWENTIGNAKPLEQGNEAWVENDIWDLCTSHQESFTIIEKAFTDIGEQGLVSEALEQLFDDI